MNKFQRDTHRHVKAASKVVAAIIISIEDAGIGNSGMRDAHHELDTAMDFLRRAAAEIAAIRNDGEEA